MEITRENHADWLDEIKGLFIFLVVFGHMTSSAGMSSASWLPMLRLYIYAIHMPMFMFISGYLSKRKGSIKKLLISLLAPYLVMQFVCVATKKLVGGGTSLTWNPLVPYGHLWYILCLLLMRLTVRYLPRKALIPCSLASIVISFMLVRGPASLFNTMALGRYFRLLPMFVIGYMLPSNQLEQMRERLLHQKKWAVIGIIICVSVEYVLFRFNLMHDDSYDYARTAWDYSSDFLCKYFLMALTLVWFAILAALFSGRSKMLKRWGKNSIIIYLIHIFFVYAAKIIYLPDSELMLFVSRLVLSLAVTQLLSMNLWKQIYDKCLATLDRLCGRLVR